jgi:hypothetical protein
MPKRRTRGGTFAALGQAASNLLVPIGLFYAAKRQQSRVANSRKRKTFRRRKTFRSF